MKAIDETIEAQFKRKRRLLEDFEYFVLYYFGYRMAPFHKEWVELATKHNWLLIEAPIKHAKSEYFSILWPLWMILRTREGLAPIPGWQRPATLKYTLRMIIASNGHTLAKEKLRKLKLIMETSDKLIADWGEFRTEYWGEERVYVKGLTGDAPTVWAVPCLGGLGGIADYIIPDDILDSKNTATVSLCRKIEDWFGGVLLGRYPPGTSGRMIVIGTEHGEHTLYQSIIKHREGKYQEFVCKVYDGITPEGKALWDHEDGVPLVRPEGDTRISHSLLKNQLGTRNYNKYIRNQVISDEGAMCRRAWFRTFKKLDLDKYTIIAGVDPAEGRSASSDDHGLTVVAYCAGDPVKHVLENYGLRGPIDTLQILMRRLWDDGVYGKYPVRHFICEKVVWIEDVMRPLVRDGIPITYQTTEGRNKMDRIATLMPFIENGSIDFHEDNTIELMLELLALPDAPHDDRSDSLEIALRSLLRKGNSRGLPRLGGGSGGDWRESGFGGGGPMPARPL